MSPEIAMSLDRRGFLHAAALPLLPLAARLGAQPPAAPGRIVRQQAPLNLEMNFAGLNRFVTPTSSFYVRNHFALPRIDQARWRLKITGAVEREVEFSLDDLKRLGPKTRRLLLECAGNGRVFLTPPARGVNWHLGAVGTAEWTGIPLGLLLEQAGVKAGAVEVVLEGADSGAIADPASPGPIPFARSLPLAKAQRPEVMLAWGMNGSDLPAEHGGPLRAVVGGWYGMASVKWLTRIIVVDQPFQGFFQSLDYTYFRRVHGLPSLTPITVLQVKSQIAAPVQDEEIAASRPYVIHGAAWSGETEVAKVEVSTDGGTNWHQATLQRELAPYCWRLWEYTWKDPAPGRARLMSRATDSQGTVQPRERDPDRRNYMISHVIPVEVDVRSRA
jgi:DMSO/TMAO reductase YedYZ molybdopterin-dependent catalytic subunit